ncbi:MAG TPA: hypothetical protein PL110_19940, partial [Candidatus Eremiobacteraeota bacterium]|nr:hypothetical protein [Candidatus Eremiobacteraeota bacterium]
FNIINRTLTQSKTMINILLDYAALESSINTYEKIDLNKELRKYEFDLSGSNFNRLNKFEFIQEKFQKEKIFLKVSQIKFSSKGQ